MRIRVAPPNRHGHSLRGRIVGLAEAAAIQTLAIPRCSPGAAAIGSFTGAGHIPTVQPHAVCALPMTENYANTTARGSSRRRTLKAGVIAYGGGHVTLPCGVRDLSDTGARLTVSGSVNAPDTFELAIDTDGLAASCEVVWRRGAEVGVRFVGAPRRLERKRLQVIDQWARTGAKPTLRRQRQGG